MGCATPKADIMRYADAELPPENTAALEQHLATCVGCTSAVAQALSLKRTVRTAGQRYSPSIDLRRQVRESISATAAQPIASRFGRMVRLWPVAIAAMMLLVGAASLRVLTNRSANEQIIAGVIDRHVAALASANPVDVVSTDRHTVKPWFQGRLPFSFNLPELSGTDFTLDGGRVTYFDGESGAQLIYALRKHRISVFIFQNRDEVARLADIATTKRSFVVESWNQGNLRYFVIADVPNSDVKILVDLLKKSAAQ